MLNYLFTVPKTAILHCITASIELNLVVLDSFILLNTLKVEGKARNWTELFYSLIIGSANSVLTKVGLIVWHVFNAR